MQRSNHPNLSGRNRQAAASGTDVGIPHRALPRARNTRFVAAARAIFTQWTGAGSNRRHTDFQSVALPTELPVRGWADLILGLRFFSVFLVVTRITVALARDGVGIHWDSLVDFAVLGGLRALVNQQGDNLNRMAGDRKLQRFGVEGRSPACDLAR